ncbi:MAG TPA: OsmC family protein [Gammaproteobacteria bacterium]|nr:OsmC family protein [Gammaproteobacteria bacterium]
MSEHKAEVVWDRNGADFLDKRYSRRHLLRFDGGLEIPASASPSVVPTPMSDPAAVDPEEAFVAALASCHMLWFLALAAERGFRVDRYRDGASGTVARYAAKRLAVTEVILRPRVEFAAGACPSQEALLALHEAAHAHCFIANSVTTEVRCEPVLTAPSIDDPQA